jgi:hypothetical protein
MPMFMPGFGERAFLFIGYLLPPRDVAGVDDGPRLRPQRRDGMARRVGGRRREVRPKLQSPVIGFGSFYNLRFL